MCYKATLASAGETAFAAEFPAFSRIKNFLCIAQKTLAPGPKGFYIRLCCGAAELAPAQIGKVDSTECGAPAAVSAAG